MRLVNSKISLLLLFILPAFYSNAQSKNKYGLTIISSQESFKQSIQKDSNNALVLINKYIPFIELDIKYATTQNIFYTKLYQQAKAYVRLPVIKALIKVEKELNEMGLGLKIYDAYRPYHITCQMYEMIPDSLYMGLPWQGSKHNRGIALDLTLIDFKSKSELKMPTPFDALVYPAHPEYMNLSKDVISNRELLKGVMKRHGFVVDPMEWWHFNYQSNKLFDLLDIPFEQLE